MAGNGKVDSGNVTIASKKSSVKAIVAQQQVEKAGAMEAIAEDVDGIAARADFFKAQYDAFIDAGLDKDAAVAALGTIRLRD